MNILHINQADIAGGAAIAGYALHKGLLTQGIDSKLLVGQIAAGSQRAALVPRKHRLERELLHVSSRLGLNYTHIIGSFGIPNHPFYQDADLLNFHNLHNGYFNYLALPQLTRHKPAIFTLHDMWSFTGHCAYSQDCDRWQSGCGSCPYPGAYPAIKRDSTRLEWKLKDWVYTRSSLVIVTPSRWLTQQAQMSMLRRFPIHHIPYGIDTDAYHPLDVDQCRTILGLPTDKKVLLFSAPSLSDSRKGSDLLLQALMKLPDSLKAEIILLTLGEYGDRVVESIDLPVVNLGYISGDRMKAIAYSAADLFVFPTRADNLPLVLLESMACGTPMVSFKVGGVPDLVRPNSTGYLAAPEATADFCNGIVQLLEDKPLREQMSQNCRQIATQEYTLAHQATRYIALYQQVLTQP